MLEQSQWWFLGVVGILILVAGRRFRWAAVALLVVVGFCAAPPYTLWTHELPPAQWVQKLLIAQHIGIAPARFGVPMYMVAIAVGLVFAVASLRTRAVPKLFLPLAAYLVLCGLFLWEGTMAQWVGIAHLLVAIAAWPVGMYLAAAVGRAPDRERLFALVLAVPLLAQTAAVAAHLLGNPLFTLTGPTSTGSDRAYGLTLHANVLSLLLFFLIVLCVPLVRSKDRCAQVVAALNIAVATGLIVLTESRVVLIAALILLLVAVLVLPRQRSSRRLLIEVGVALHVGAVLAGTMVPRFVDDPYGGGRYDLIKAALARIPDNLLFGFGPNSYTKAMSAFDERAAIGVPVHNVGLYLIAELGVIGAALLLVPLAALAVRAWKGRTSPDRNRDYAWVALAALPGLVLIALTDWSLLAHERLGLWLLVSGYFWYQITPAAVSTTASATEEEATAPPPEYAQV